jgi:DNA-binding transcriptional LysR family regulator
MHIENFKIFADLIETKSFSRAGKINGLSQSAVSQQLRAMETHFDVQILDRSQKRFHLTREGELLRTAAREILRAYTKMDSEIKAMRERVDGTIRLSTIHSIGLHELPVVLKRFLTKHPTVNFRIEYRRSNVVVEDVEHNASDFGLLAYPEDVSGLEIIPFAEDVLIAICSPNHVFASRKDITLGDFAGQHFINYDSDIPTRKALDKAFEKKKIRPNTVMESDNVETIKRAVEVDVGLALVPSATVQQELVQGTLVGLKLRDCAVKRPLAIVHRKGFVLTPAMNVFIRMMAETGKPGPLASLPVAGAASSRNGEG